MFRKIVFLFFLFKQKTAYEMRISDWSSDVCSSDLVTLAPFRFTQGAYTLVSVMARYNITDQVEIQANVENLLDKTYFSQVGFYSQYRYGAPRNFTVGATYRF